MVPRDTIVAFERGAFVIIDGAHSRQAVSPAGSCSFISALDCSVSLSRWQQHLPFIGAWLAPLGYGLVCPSNEHNSEHIDWPQLRNVERAGCFERICALNVGMSAAGEAGEGMRKDRGLGAIEDAI